MESKMSISGLKQSPELVQINLSAGDSPPIVLLFDRLARHRINMAFVTMAAAAGSVIGTCAVALEDWAAAEPLLQGAGVTVGVISPVGTLTVFPHRSRGDLLEGVLSAFIRAGLPVYCVTSSLATLTFATDYRRMAEAVSEVRAIAHLPENHAPLERPWCVKQV
ncbi:MAG: hypothetical protein ABIL58_07660 [Pseudomonadota bacterium]